MILRWPVVSVTGRAALHPWFTTFPIEEGVWTTRAVAEKILTNVGGPENIASYGHCATRRPGR